MILNIKIISNSRGNKTFLIKNISRKHGTARAALNGRLNRKKAGTSGLALLMEVIIYFLGHRAGNAFDLLEILHARARHFLRGTEMQQQGFLALGADPRHVVERRC